jgi:hypothetical protein
MNISNIRFLTILSDFLKIKTLTTRRRVFCSIIIRRTPTTFIIVSKTPIIIAAYFTSNISSAIRSLRVKPVNR